MESLDLHGVRHADAEEIIDDFIGRHFDKLPIEIITGNSIQMQNFLKEIVNSYKLKMEPTSYINLGSYVISYGVNN